MIIEILSPNSGMRKISISASLESHWNIPINHSNTILNQINGGMYSRWFNEKKDMVCIDFGSNVGIVALYMLPVCKRIYCVEPTPSHYELMKELLEANNGKTEVMLSKFALTGFEEEVVFATGHSTENKVSSEDGYGSVKIKVQGKPLSWFINDIGENIDFVKCDIEGFEIYALTEEQIKLAYGKVKCFFVECHPSQSYSMDSCRETLISRFKDAGYEIETIDYQTFVATC